MASSPSATGANQSPAAPPSARRAASPLWREAPEQRRQQPRGARLPRGVGLAAAAAVSLALWAGLFWALDRIIG